MIYAYIEAAPENGLYIFKSWQAMRAAIKEEIQNGKPVKVRAAANTEITRTDYTGNKLQARNALIDLQRVACTGDLSYSELGTIYNAAERIARRYGLLREARENAIC